MRFAFFAVLFSCLAATAAADPYEAPTRRVVLEMRSDILDEDRTFIVHLPQSYFMKPARTYPVFYISDADWNAELVASTLEYLSHWGRIPEFIAVSAMNTSRNKDFVPRVDERFPNTGGGDRYLQHIEREWMPLIAENFRVSDNRVLFGHSFGGVLALNQLFSKPDLFDAYIALGSSVWVSDRVLFERAEAAFAEKTVDAFLYLSVGEGDGGATVPDGDLFAELLREKAPDSLEWSYTVFPGENHFTNVPVSLHYALTALFPFWGFDEELREAATENGVRGVNRWFDNKQARLGWRFEPQSMELGLAAYALAAEDRLEPAIAIFDRLEEAFPDRPEVIATRASAMHVAGESGLALADVTRAITLGETVGHYADRLQAFRNFRNTLTSPDGAE